MSILQADILEAEVQRLRSEYLMALKAVSIPKTPEQQRDMDLINALQAGAYALRTLDGASPLYWHPDDGEYGHADLAEYADHFELQIEDTMPVRHGLSLHALTYIAFVATEVSAWDEDGRPEDWEADIREFSSEAEAGMAWQQSVDALRPADTAKGGAA